MKRSGDDTTGIRCQAHTAQNRVDKQCQHTDATYTIDLTTLGLYARVCDLHCQLHEYLVETHGAHVADRRIMEGLVR